MIQISYIDGEFVEPSSDERFRSTDPYTGEEWTEIPPGMAPDVGCAVKTTHEAVFHVEWAELTQTERGKYLYKVADIRENRVETNTEIEVRNNGKPIREMRSQHDAIPDWYRHYAGLADKIRDKTIASNKFNKHVYTEKHPF